MAESCPVNGHSFVHGVNVIHIKPSEAQLEGILRYPNL
jgi:hypothetical protein